MMAYTHPFGEPKAKKVAEVDLDEPPAEETF
jgi:hypothetical protein